MSRHDQYRRGSADALVRNAGDERRVAAAADLELRRRDRALDDMRFVMGSPEGRRVMWRLLEHCGVHRSIWRPSAEIHMLAGQQNVGLYLEAEMAAADEELLYRMQREARARVKQETAEAAAVDASANTEDDQL